MSQKYPPMKFGLVFGPILFVLTLLFDCPLEGLSETGWRLRF